MITALPPSAMTADERLDEVARILAAGLIRLRRANSTKISDAGTESSLDCPLPQSGHGRQRNPVGAKR